MDAHVQPNFWSDSRSLAVTWAIINKTGLELNLSLYPCILRAFANLHSYFAANPISKYPSYVISIAAIISSIKSCELPTLSITWIYSAFLRVCKSLGQMKNLQARQTLLDRFPVNVYTEKLSEQQMREIYRAEMDILAANKFVPVIKIPQDLIEQKVLPYLPSDSHIPEVILRNNSAILRSIHYQKLPIDVIAFVVTKNAFGDQQIPHEIDEWLRTTQLAHEQWLFERAAQSLSFTLKSA